MMRMTSSRYRLSLVLTAFAIILSVSLGQEPSLLASAAVSASTLAAKTCKTVIKHGKKTKVCTAVLPSDRQAQQLADRVYGATTPQARYTALLHVAQALHLGVYTANGRAIVKGAERGPNDFYLYAFQLRSVAGALERGQTSTLADVLADLEPAKLTGADGQTLTEESLRQAMLGVIRAAAAQPKRATSLSPLLVRDLGLHHNPSYDLVGDVPSDAIHLDSLQTLLIIMGFLVPPATQAHATTRQSRVARILARSSGGVLHYRSTVTASPCGAFKGTKAAGYLNVSWWGLLVGLGWNNPFTATTLQVAIWTVAAQIVRDSVAVERVGSPLVATHFGPAGHETDGGIGNAGDPMVFKFLVRMVDDLTDSWVNCGALTGLTLPKPGPIPGAVVEWLPSPELAPSFGTVVRSDEVTDGDGIATMIVQPKDEQFPGFGTVHHADGIVRARFLFGHTFGINAASAILQYWEEKDNLTGWEVSWHDHRGFQFGPVTFTWDGQPNPNFVPPPCTIYCYVGSGCDPHYCHGNMVSDHAEWTVTGHICGKDPHSVWQVTAHNAGQRRFEDGYVNSTVDANRVDTTSYWTLTDKNTFVNVSGPTAVTGLTGTTGSFQAGPPPQVSIRVTTSSGTGSSWLEMPTDQTKTVPVTEDTSCPDTSSSP